MLSRSNSTVRVSRLAVFATAIALGASALAGPASAASAPHMVRDISPSGASSPAELTPIGNTLFFTADGKGGRELWKTDGSQAGTMRVKNIRPGAASSWPSNLTVVGTTLYFYAFDGVGWGIWTSDGTSAGTQIVDYIDTDSATFTSYLGNLYFVSYDELWRTDGTVLGTTFVKQVATWPDTFVTEMRVVGDRLFIAVDANELWMSDGTESGTTFVESIESPGMGVHTLTRAGDRLFFLRDTEGNVIGPNPAELWTSNGTAAGTKLVKDFVAGDNDYVYNLIAAKGRAYVTAGGRLWKSNGYASGTKLLADGVANKHPLTNVGGTVYFVGADGVWKTDGTSAGTVSVSDIFPYLPPCPPHTPCGPASSDNYPVGFGGQLFYAADAGGLGPELWVTDDSDDGAGHLGDLRPGSQGSRPANLTRVGETLYFTANDGTHGRELWRYVP
jgi:ELWxxDGT repeat protein